MAKSRLRDQTPTAMIAKPMNTAFDGRSPGA